MKTEISKPALLGIPLDANSSYLRGPAKAPPLIRKAFHSDSSNSWSETGMNVGEPGAFLDAGDVKLPDDIGALELIEQGVGQLVEKGHSPVCLGGDHSVTYPILRAFAKRFPNLTIVHFDAHPDLYHEFQGSRYSHCLPFCPHHGREASEEANPDWHSRHGAASA
jgi:arginase